MIPFDYAKLPLFHWRRTDLHFMCSLCLPSMTDVVCVSNKIMYSKFIVQLNKSSNRLKCHTHAMHLKIGPDSATRHLSQSLLAPFRRKLCFVFRAERWLFHAPIYIFFANLKPTFPFTTFNCEPNATVTSSTAVRYLFSWLYVSAGIRTRNTLCH